MLIVDAHLDLAYNAWLGRAVDRPAREQTLGELWIPTVGLPDLRVGGVGLACATVFCEPKSEKHPGYSTADEAHVQLQQQLGWYRKQELAGTMKFVRQASELPDGDALPPNDSRLSAILLLEGADPIRDESDLAALHAWGLRMVGLAWHRTRFAGGTGEPGPLTPAGVELVQQLDRFGIIHDASHLAEESFWQLLDLSNGPIVATHSNCRAIVPTDRQLSDEMIRAISGRGGVIGINFFDRFLLPPDQYGKRRATLQDIIPHIRRLCDVTGDVRHVGLGTDMDGGFGREEIPIEIETASDLPRLAWTLSKAGFTSEEVNGIMGENWLKFFKRALPA